MAKSTNTKVLAANEKKAATQAQLEAVPTTLESSVPAAKGKAAGAGKLATLTSTAAELASLWAEARGGRATAHTEQLNASAGALGKPGKAQQEVLGHHLDVIRGTSHKCDGILQDVGA